MNRGFNPLQVLPIASIDLLKSVSRIGKWLSLPDSPLKSTDIPGDFIGVNVAPSDDPAVDQYILDRLTELGLRHIRMDFTYSSENGPAQRLLDTLLQHGYRVMLDVFPDIDEAGVLYKNTGAQSRWADFLARIFQDYQDKVECFEIGATPNRGKWSGFSSRSMLSAWYVAIEVADRYQVNLAGPNVSDFEPIFNATYLSLLRRFGRAPKIHTDNLFVERVIEPEAYDHRVFGRLATNHLKLNLVKKARILQHISQQTGSEETWCTYTCWTKKRLSRQAAWPEDKCADYLVRYLALAAASGALNRVYWGPLICSRDGLISTQHQEYPVIDQVSFYQRTYGELAEFSRRTVYYALKHTAQQLLAGRCFNIDHQVDGLSLFGIQNSSGQIFELCWSRDRMAFPLLEVYSEDKLSGALFYNSQGQAIPRPVVINEHPQFIEFKDSTAPRENRPGVNFGAQDTVHLSSPEHQSIGYHEDQWRGAYMLRTSTQDNDLESARALNPSAIPHLEETTVLRNARNRLWNVADPRERTGHVTVKLNRATGFKRISYRFRPSKGRRHWNNACEMLRRGISTPLPVAFHERPQQPGVRDSWYLCEYIPGAFSAREVYAAFRDGAALFKGLDKQSWLELLSEFICKMHNRQIVHRDLSSGNLLIRQEPDGSIQPMVIDIGRAWLGRGSGIGQRHRLLDLIRIAYKLNWEDRARFIAAYESHMERSLSPLWRVPFLYYDSKQALKKGMKRKYRKK